MQRTDDMEGVVLHPIRMRMIQLLAYNESMTVADLADAMKDIPRSTIYRHVSVLHEHGILTVVREQKIRGTYEREYALNRERAAETEREMDQVISGMLLKLLSDFSNYFRDEGANPDDDKLFFSVNALLLTDLEFEELKEELFDVVKRYMNRKPEPERKTRTLSVISSPCSARESWKD